MDLKELKKKIPYQWRVQSYSKNKASATCVAYIDARDVMELLDEVCGPENWQSDFKEVSGQIYGGVGIYVNGAPDTHGGWLWKWDTGSESNVEKEKGQASDAFKRAAVKWGIGRFLYDLEVAYVKTNGPLSDSNKYPYVVDDAGQRVWDLSDHINRSGTRKATTSTITPKPVPPAKVADKRDALKKRIKELIDDISLVPLTTGLEYREYVRNNFDLELEPDYFEAVIEKLEAIKTKNE